MSSEKASISVAQIEQILKVILYLKMFANERSEFDAMMFLKPFYL